MGRLAKRIASEGPVRAVSYLHWKRRLARVGGSGARYPGQNTREERRKRQREHVSGFDREPIIPDTSMRDRRTAISPRHMKVDDRTLYPGDFIHSEGGTLDHRGVE